MTNDTVEQQMRIALNGCGTASFDPMPSVARFLKEKERRYREPEPCVSTWIGHCFCNFF